MPKGYSDDLRWRIVFLACFCGNTIEEVTRALYVSHSTVERVVSLYQTTGEVTPAQQRHGPCRTLDESDQLIVLESFLNNPGIYLREVQEELLKASGKLVSWPTICRTAKQLGLSRQKMKKVAIQRSDILRAQYMAEMEAFDPNMLVFIDETGSDRRKTMRQFGYGIRGLTPTSPHLLCYGDCISAISVISMRGVEDAYLVEGNVDGDMFLRFVQTSLLNIIQSFDGNNSRSVVVLDNASIHHVEAVCDLISAAGALIRFLPPYSPDLNPIEEVFSKVKGYLIDNEIAYKSTSEPRIIILEAFGSVTKQDCINYIKHSGYTK